MMADMPDTSNWTEFDWEKYLRENDQYASRFYALLKRFYDLPGANELIAHKMSREFKHQMLDCDFDCERCDKRTDCEFSTERQDWSGFGAYDAEDDDDPGHAAGPGDAIFYETDRNFVMLRQTAIGWCNIYAAILPQDARPAGLRILFHIGRALANLAYSIGDGSGAQPPASVALAKRSLDQLNTAIGQISQLAHDKPRLKKILDTMTGHLLRCRDGVIAHLQSSRSHSGDNAAENP